MSSVVIPGPYIVKLSELESSTRRRKGMLIVAGYLRVLEAERDGFVNDSRAVVEQARGADGSLDFALSADLVEPDRVLVFERWDDRAPSKPSAVRVRETSNSRSSRSSKSMSTTLSPARRPRRCGPRWRPFRSATCQRRRAGTPHSSAVSRTRVPWAVWWSGARRPRVHSNW